MKRIVCLLLFVLIGTAVFAQTYRYRAKCYASGSRNYYGEVVWGDWQASSVVITIDTQRDFIKVYSNRDQNYVIVGSSNEYTDKFGGSRIDFTAVDEEGIECTISLRAQQDGVIQLYAFYSNVAWVYSNLEVI